MKKRYLSMALLAISSLSLLTGCNMSMLQEIQDKIMTGTSAPSEYQNEDVSMDDVEDKLDEMQELIDENFYFDEEEVDMETGIYKGYVESLNDPYSVYYTAEEWAELQQETSGEYVGIGVQVSQDVKTMTITVTRVFAGGPAEEAGVLKGDVVTAVGDWELAGEDVSDVVEVIKGEEGTTVDVTVYRPSIKDYVTMTIERRKVENSTVSYEMVTDQIGYIQVTDFYEATAQQYVIGVRELISQGMKGLVVDLRDNPGGLLSAVIEMLDFMLPEGMLVYTEDKDGNITSQYQSSDADSFDMPVVVLVNGNSASASEIFAGAMQDHGAAKILGTQTYGKGIVQRLFQLQDGSCIKLTVSKYFTPNGNDIHGIGITPDILLDLPDELKTKSVIEFEDDVQLQEAVSVLEKEIQ